MFGFETRYTVTSSTSARLVEWKRKELLYCRRLSSMRLSTCLARRVSTSNTVSKDTRESKLLGLVDVDSHESIPRTSARYCSDVTTLYGLQTSPPEQFWSRAPNIEGRRSGRSGAQRQVSQRFPVRDYMSYGV